MQQHDEGDRSYTAYDPNGLPILLSLALLPLFLSTTVRRSRSQGMTCSIDMRKQLSSAGELFVADITSLHQGWISESADITQMKYTLVLQLRLPALWPVL